VGDAGCVVRLTLGDVSVSDGDTEKEVGVGSGFDGVNGRDAV
jgi:hypothetical protein